MHAIYLVLAYATLGFWASVRVAGIIALAMALVVGDLVSLAGYLLATWPYRWLARLAIVAATLWVLAEEVPG